MDSSQRRFDKLGPEQAEAIKRLRAQDQFFWLDLEVQKDTFDRLAEVLGVPEHAIAVLKDFRHGKMVPRYHADGEHVVFPFDCVRKPDAPISGPAEAMYPLEVRVLVHGGYMLTVHHGKFDLQGLAGELPPGRSEQYWVYSVLDAMTQSLFEAMATIEEALETVENDLAEQKPGQFALHRQIVRGARARLTALRRRIAPQRGIFERISEEITEVEGLSASKNREYFERIHAQLDRIVDAIDAGSQEISTLLDLRLNETIYRLTVVATIFLPLTFVTSFFGMNFGWMVGEIDSSAAFLLLGVGLTALSGVAAAWLIKTDGEIPWLRRLLRRRGRPT